MTNEKYKLFIELKAKTIEAITQQIKQASDNMHMSMYAVGNKADIVASVHEKFTARVLKSNIAIAELAKCLYSKSEKINSCNLTLLCENIVKNTNTTLPDANVQLMNSEEIHIATCDLAALEKAIYSVLCAFAFHNKECNCEIKINKNEVMITAKNLKWNEAQLDFARGNRLDTLCEDIHKFGYDMPRAINLLDWQNGELSIEDNERDTVVTLKLPEVKTDSDNVLLLSEEVKYLSLGEVDIIFSDLI